MVVFLIVFLMDVQLCPGVPVGLKVFFPFGW